MKASEIVRSIIAIDGAADMQNSLLDLFLKPANESAEIFLKNLPKHTNNVTAKPTELRFRDPPQVVSKRYSQEREHPFTAQVKQMALEGMPQWKIAAKLGIGAGTVGDILKKVGLKTIRTRGRTLSDDDGNRILNLHKQGLSIIQIAMQMDISPTSVSYVINGNHPVFNAEGKGK